MMENNNNLSDIFIRELLIATRNHFTNKIFYDIIKPDGNKRRVIYPVNLPIAGDERFLEDAFVDDFPDNRVELNVDQKQRITIMPKTWSILNAEFANSDIYISKTEEIDNSFKEIAVQMKMLPFELVFDAKIFGASSNDVFLAFQLFLEHCFKYDFLTFYYKKLPLVATLIINDDNESNIGREFGFTDNVDNNMIISFKIKTVLPIYDLSKAISPIKTNWQVDLKEYTKIDKN